LDSILDPPAKYGGPETLFSLAVEGRQVREWLDDDCENRPCNFAQQELDPATFGSLTIDTIASIRHLLSSLEPAHAGEAVCNRRGMARINESDTSTILTFFGSL